MVSWKSNALVTIVGTVSAATVAIPIHKAMLDDAARSSNARDARLGLWSQSPQVLQLQEQVRGNDLMDDLPDGLDRKDHSSALSGNAINITIDSQQYEVVVDTSHSFLWMPELVCESEATLDCQGTIGIGDLKIEEQAFAGARAGLGHFNPDGILGLAFTPPADELQSPLNNMIAQGLIDEPIFSLSLGTSGGEIIFGGINEDLFAGNLTKLPLIGDAGWQVELSAISYGGNAIELEDTSAVFDSGTSGMMLPTALAGTINAAIASDGCGKVDALLDLKFMLAGHEFSIGPEQYTSGSGDNCSSRITGWDLWLSGRPLIVSGSAFLEEWYSVFNAGDASVSLARAK